METFLLCSYTHIQLPHYRPYSPSKLASLQRSYCRKVEHAQTSRWGLVKDKRNRLNDPFRAKVKRITGFQGLEEHLPQWNTSLVGKRLHLTPCNDRTRTGCNKNVNYIVPFEVECPQM